MKTRSMMIVALLVGGSMCGATVAHAGIMPVNSNDWIKVFDAGGTHYSNGGPFRIDNVTTNQGNVLTTFCLERDETLTYGTKYRVELSTIAQLGGVNTKLGDPLDSMTAYLFTNFHHGTNGGNAWNTADLQEAIWYIEEELPSNHTLSSGAQTLYTLAANNANGSLYDVRVMNLFDANGKHAQSLLTVVPEPATLVMWSLFALCGLMVVRRRQRRIPSSDIA